MPTYKCSYQLSEPSSISATCIENGIRIWLKEAEVRVWLESVDAQTPDEALLIGLDLCERFLDTLARECNEYLRTKWRPIPSVQEIDHKGFPVGIQKVAVEFALTPKGTSPSSSLRLSASFAPRFYRRAVTSEDWFEKFRNYFLVVEYVGSRLWWESRSQRWRSDLELVSFAVKSAYASSHDLLSVARGRVLLSGKNDYLDVARYLIVKHRHEISHAQLPSDYRQRRKRLYKVPFEPWDEAAVKEAVPLVGDVARRLLMREREINHSP